MTSPIGYKTDTITVVLFLLIMVMVAMAGISNHHGTPPSVSINGSQKVTGDVQIETDGSVVVDVSRNGAVTTVKIKAR